MQIIKILNLIKTRSTLSCCRKCLWCVTDIFALTNSVFVWQKGLYTFGCILILTPGFNQSSWGESGKYPSPVILSVQLVGGCYGLSVRGLRFVAVVSRLF